MASATSWTLPASSHSSLFVKLPTNNTSSHKHIELKLRKENEGNRSLQCFRCSHFETNSISEIPTFSGSSLPASLVVSDKLNLLVSEFRSLSEPIDRVKRLLHFATLLPPLEESARMPENRVRGCTTQVWLTAEMDERGRMRFRADSDSEITRGFCWCLIWMLDGAEAEEVMAVEAEDLAAMNVGLHVKARSRVHTWHNVLFSMQKTTQTLLLHRVNDQSGWLMINNCFVSFPRHANFQVWMKIDLFTCPGLWNLKIFIQELRVPVWLRVGVHHLSGQDFIKWFRFLYISILKYRVNC